MATTSATFAYKEAHDERFARTYFRRAGDVVVSSIGMGTYLGDPTDAVDERYEAALVAGLESGCNVVDTASNYRHRRSERVVGRALDEADVDREAVFLASKGGFVPFEGERPENPGAYVRREYVEPGLIDPDDLVRGNCIAPDFVDDQLDRSLAALDVDALDCYYVHNPETQLGERSREAVYDQLEATFERLEARVEAGEIRRYGVATWNAFRVPPDDDQYLSLPEVLSRAERAAESAGREETGLRVIQLPFNVAMADAFTVEAHDGQSALWFAHDAGLSVFASASLAGGDLVSGLPPAVADELAGETAAQRALNFARSAPGVTCALVGTTREDHVEENVGAGAFTPMGAAAFDAVFE